MNIDEFLLSTEHRFFINEQYGSIVKIKYNEYIDFLYQTKMFNQLDYDVGLDFIGLLHRPTKSLYGQDRYCFEYEFSKKLKKVIYKGSIEDIYKNIENEVNVLLNKYIDAHKEELKKISSNRFDKDVKENKLYVKDLKNYAREMYIYKMRNAMEFKSYYTNNYFKVHKEVIYDYLQDKKSTVEKLFENYILDDINLYDIKVSVKNQIGYTLLENEFKENVIINEFEHNPKNEVKKIHDIIDSIKNIYAKELVLTVTKNNQTISFRFPKRELYSQSIWNMYIKNTSERKLVEELYDNRDFSMKDIIKIEYRKKLLYKDNNKKRKIYNKCVDSNTHKWYNNIVIGKGVQKNSIRTTKMTVTVDDFLDMLIDRGSQEIEIYSFMQGRTVFSGYDDDMDFEFKYMTVSSFEIFNDKLVINVDDEC